MSDSVKVIQREAATRIHSQRASGRIHKGHNITAANASIPSKYQTIVEDNSEQKGFNSRAKRFSSDSATYDKPGPGSYLQHIGSVRVSPSYSKKGTGGFASKDRRIQKQAIVCSPGAGAYFLPSQLNTRKDFNRTDATRIFTKPIAVSKENSTDDLPSPCQYEVYRAGRLQGRTNNVSADAAFKSTSRRDVISTGDGQRQPAPWQYHISEQLVKDSVKVPFSSFRSQTQRQIGQFEHDGPGPGAYKPHEKVDAANKITFPRKHYLCISAPAMPLPATPPSPGPGSYDVVNYEGPPKHFMSSAAFVSSTSRWTGAGRPGAALVPGPAHYRPGDGGKQSFIYNAQGRWI